MATPVINSNGMTNGSEDEVDFFFSQQRTSEPMFETSVCIAHFDPTTSKEDFPLHYAVFQGDLNAVKKLVDTTNIDSLDTHGEYKCI